ncbi:MAG: AMP-binding protein, partial [Pseudolabrys sp.]
MLPSARDYDTIYRQFRWQVPARYNIGVDVCDRWAAEDPGRLAILNVRSDGREDAITFGWLRETSNRLANVLRAHGVARGDRVAIMLPQAPEVAAAHIAIYKLGAVALPIAILFGPDALAYRLQNSGAAALLTNAQGLTRLAEIRGGAPALKAVLSVDGAGDKALDFAAALSRASLDFTPEDTAANDPAMMIYTSGTTGQPKGALHAHRVLIGHLPGIEMPHYPFPVDGDRYWTPADWAWA